MGSTRSVLWECYSRDFSGVALVMAHNRREAVRLCRYWLGWNSIAAAFRASENMGAFLAAGGAPEHPVAYSEDGERFNLVDMRGRETVEV